MARARHTPEPRRPMSRTRRAYMVGVLGVVATLLVLAAYESRADSIHIRLVNKSGAVMKNVVLEQGDKRAESRALGPDQAVALDVKPRVAVPIHVTLQSQAGDQFAAFFKMFGRTEPPLPGDYFVITVYGAGKDEHGVNVLQVAPEVIKDTSPLRRVRRLFGW